MVVGLSAAIVPKSFLLFRSSLPLNKSTPVFAPLGCRRFSNGGTTRKKTNFTVCFVVQDKKQKNQIEDFSDEETSVDTEIQISAARLAEKLTRKRSERFTYLIAAVMSSFGITSMAVLAVYYRFSWQMEVRTFTDSIFSKFVLSTYLYTVQFNILIGKKKFVSTDIFSSITGRTSASF